MFLLCEILSSVHLSGTAFTHHVLNVSPLSQPYFDVIKWNRKHSYKSKKQADILILDNVKTLKLVIFSRLRP